MPFAGQVAEGKEREKAGILKLSFLMAPLLMGDIDGRRFA